MDKTSPAIETQDLAKRFGRTSALAGLTMTVPRGRIFGFLGPNGAGKTTAVKLLLGLTRPTSGRARVLGRPAGDRNTRRRIGYLPELFRYQGWLSAREVLAFHCQLAGIPRPQWRDEVDTALSTVDLSERADNRVESYSKGMQQRLGLAVALLGRPELVFLDEPTSALDPVGRHDVRRILRDLRSAGMAVFLNSHLLSEVEQVCDQVAVIDFGRVVMSGTLEQVLGGAGAVRLRVTGLDDSRLAALSRFGRIERESEWLTVHGLEAESVPTLVAAIVAEGGRIYAVDPRAQTLEDRFLQALSGNQPPRP